MLEDLGWVVPVGSSADAAADVVTAGYLRECSEVVTDLEGYVRKIVVGFAVGVGVVVVVHSAVDVVVVGRKVTVEGETAEID